MRKSKLVIEYRNKIRLKNIIRIKHMYENSNAPKDVKISTKCDILIDNYLNNLLESK